MLPKKYDFQIVNGDTDSISFCKRDGKPFTPEEQKAILEDFNSVLPKRVKLANDGYFHKFIVLKAKNYILYDGKKIKLKGSSLKSGTKEQALKDFTQEIIDCIVHDRPVYKEVYDKYCREALKIKDIKRWTSRKTLTRKTYESVRQNEQKIIQAIQGSEYVEGDRVWLYFLPDGTLRLAEQFDGYYDEMVMLKKLFNASKVFANVLATDVYFPNYTLKRNRPLLESLK